MYLNFKKLHHAAKLTIYKEINTMPFNYEAVFSDESPEYVTWNCNEVTIRLRTHREQECACSLNVVNSDGSCSAMEMKKISSLGFFDYYVKSFKPCEKIRYYFKIVFDGHVYYYNKKGIFKDIDNNFNFTFVAGFETPEWAKGAVMYQIFVDRFYNGDKSNDVIDNEYSYLGGAAKIIDDWKEPVRKNDICNFYGGDIQGIIDKMGYLKELGIEALYLNPIFVSPSSHKYDIQDYDHVDPHFGKIVNDGGERLYFEKFNNKYASKYIFRTTDKENLEASDKLFVKFVEIAHENGIKVILDGVFNHCGAFNKWLDREGFYEKNGYPVGAFKEQESPYHDYFSWKYPAFWPDNENYECWWEHKNHPKLNYEGSEELYSYIMEVAKKWVSPPYNADGWRLDVAADLGLTREFNHKFWRDFRKEVKAANPEAIIIAEHYGDPSDWLDGKQWDTIMNYDAFMEPVTWFLCGMEKHSEEFKGDLLNNPQAFEGAMKYYMSRLPCAASLTAMNQLSNHDHSRFLTRTNMRSGRLASHGSKTASEGIDKRVMYLAVCVQMTWPGAPCVYYGDEAGLVGWTDPDNRRPYPWGREDKNMIKFHKAIIAIRKQSVALKKGALEYLILDTGLLCYSRVFGGDKIITAVNNNSEEIEINIPVWKLNVKDGSFVKLIETYDGLFEEDSAIFTATKGMLEITLKEKSCIILAVKQAIF